MMQPILAHIAVGLLALCYGTATLVEPLEELARVVYPGSAPQRITTAKPTKPISGTTVVATRRHVPLTKQIELPEHLAGVVAGGIHSVRVAALPLPEEQRCASQALPHLFRSRAPPCR